MLRVPRPAERTLARDVQRGISFLYRAVVDVDTVLVLKGRVRALPGCDPAAAAAEEDVTGLNPEGAEAVEEICLACDGGFVHVYVSQLADVDLGKYQGCA